MEGLNAPVDDGAAAFAAPTHISDPMSKDEAIAAIKVRQEERQAEIAAKRRQRTGDADPAESASLFYAEFTAMRQALSQKLAEAGAPTTPKDQLPSLFATLLADSGQLQKHLNESVGEPPPPCC